MSYPYHSQSPKNNYQKDQYNQFSPGRDSGEFKPLEFSSPVNRQRHSGNNNSWRSFHRRSYGGHNSSASPYNSYNNSYNRNNRTFNNRSNRRSQHRHSFNNAYPNQDENEFYYHPSMLEDPWAELEEKFKSDDESKSSSSEQKNKSTDTNIITLSEDSSEGSNDNQSEKEKSLIDKSCSTNNTTNPD